MLLFDCPLPPGQPVIFCPSVLSVILGMRLAFHFICTFKPLFCVHSEDLQLVFDVYTPDLNFRNLVKYLFKYVQLEKNRVISIDGHRVNKYRFSSFRGAQVPTANLAMNEEPQ